VTPGTHIDDRAARERIRNSLADSLIVEASAGTGKTSELVRRIVRVLESGLTTIDRIVAVTFTNKAAGELKLRLRQELDQARAAARDAQAKANLEAALEHLEEASIGTIHAFCAQILRERPVEASVDPAFGELTEAEAGRIYGRAFRGWIERKLAEPAPGLRRALVRLAWRESYNAGPPMEQIQEAGRRLIDWRDYPAAWRRDLFERESRIDALLRDVRELAALSERRARPKDYLYLALAPVRELARWAERAEALRERDYDTLESLLLNLAADLKRDKRSGSGVFSEGVPRQEVLDRRQRLIEALEAFRADADADLAVVLRDEMQGLLDRYEDLKRRSGKLDFTDLLVLVRRLVRDNAEVRSYLQQRYTHIFVDEFQDTDPLQVEILLLLAADGAEGADWHTATPKPGKLFVVGDPKQSIYKFRRADVVLYRQVRDWLEQRGVGVVHLTRSFRAVRPIQECVNAAFAAEMTGDAAAGQAEYRPLEQHRAAIGGQPSVIALPAPRPYATRRLAKSAINRCLPDTVVGFVEWLLRDSGWKVAEPETGDLVPVAARHVAILFRRFVNYGVDLTRDYVRSLEARSIPHLLVGSKSFHKREEVETLRAALSAVEWPEDELSVYATLRGSLFAVPDATLLRYRHEIGRLDPLRKPPENPPQEFQPVVKALGLVAELHRGRNWRPVADTVNRLLEATRSHAGFALRPAGRQVLANVYRVAELARAFETGGGISFRGFVEELEAQSEKSESQEAPVLEEGAEGIRLMTVHTAKGLEFPVVILADMTANLAAGDPERYVDGKKGLCAARILRCAPRELVEHEAEERAREQAEGVRVAYVAATRARDLLVVPVVGDEEMEGWLSPLNKALYPPKERRRKAAPAPGCGKFGPASVLDRPAELLREGEFSVQPGLHQPREGTHAVVWWDPARLRLEVEGSFGLRQQEILADSGPRAEAGAREYAEWRAQREQVLERGARPLYELFTASEAAAGPEGFACPMEILAAGRAEGRPAGRRFGTLAHQVLRDVRLDGGRGAVQALARMHARLLGAPPEEADAAVEAALAALAHPLLERARRAERLHREWPVLLKLEDGRMLEGVIDLAFQEADAWTIVDFKSDADLEAHQAHYRRQLQWYCFALSRVTRQAVRGVLLSI